MSSSTNIDLCTGSSEQPENTRSETDKSSGLKRRWSRNISLQRNRELDRLNQVERRRQLLELKRQNDLFNQMSLSKEISDKLQVKRREGGEQSVKKSLDYLNNNQNTNEQHNDDSKSIRPCSTGSLSNELTLPADESPRVKSDSNNKGKAELAGETSGQMKNELLTSKTAMTTTTTNSVNKQEPSNITKRPLTDQQLKTFVSTCVPRNKRVLCLIVRDKMSRLDKAKSSYFYPTYYLFIQSIVDFDETKEYQQLYSSSGLRLVGSSEDDEENHNEMASRDSLGAHNEMKSAKPSWLDNSFSASSSISADMLFVETTSNAHSSQVMIGHTGNSYSDNENYVESADQDESPTEVKVKRSSCKQAAAANVCSQGRDSPLVFPNESQLVGSKSSSSSLRRQSVLESSQNESDSLSTNPKEKLGELELLKSRRKQLQLAAATRIAGKQLQSSNEDSNEDDLDEDSEDDLNRQQQVVCKPSVAPNAVQTNASHNVDDDGHFRKDLTLLFDDEKNPYTGTFGILLAGRRRKKAKT